MLNILSMIDQHAIQHPDRLAFTGSQGEITYRDLVNKSNILEIYLRQSIPADHSPVAVFGHKQPEMLIAFLGAVKSGHPYIPIDDSYPLNRVERIKEIGKPALLLDREQVKRITQDHPDPHDFIYSPPSESDPWYILFTSGSTGEPKGVVITTGCLSSFVEWMLAEHHFSQDEIFLNQAPFSFDLSVMDLYPSLVIGGTEVAVTRDEIANPKQLFANLSSHSISTWVSTPSFADMCLVETGFSQGMIPSLRRFLFCGETLSPELASDLLKRFPQSDVWNTYGPTEATVATTSVHITPEVINQYHPLPVGYPKPDTNILVYLPGTDQLVEEGERGEIIIAGPNVSPGYISRQDLTAKAFFVHQGQRAYHTGDWGYTQNGLLFFGGRMDDQIKLHGYRIELGDIEVNLCHLPEVQDAIVMPVLRDGLPDQLAAFVILSERTPHKEEISEFEQTQDLKHKLATLLPSYMVPRRFLYLSAYPLTTNGKADRRKLVELIQ